MSESSERKPWEVARKLLVGIGKDYDTLVGTSAPEGVFYYNPELVDDAADAERWERLRNEGGWVYQDGKVVARVEPGCLIAGEPPRASEPTLREQILAEIDAHGGDREQLADALLDVMADQYDY